MNSSLYIRAFKQGAFCTPCFKHVTIICILLLSLAVNDIHASTINDTIQYRFSYSVKMRAFFENKKRRDDEICVDIGKRMTTCYSRWYAENRRLLDSVSSIGGNVNDYQIVRQQKGFPSAAFEFNIYKNYPNKGINSVIWNSNKRMYYEEDATIQQWEMIGGDTIIMGYNCKKARTQFRGREWLVWYTMDIPISEGPWKLCGLPGMILQAEDRNGLFTFCCIGIKSHINEPLVPNFSKAIKSTFKKVQELMTLYYSDHERYKKVTGFNYQMFDQNNKPYVIPKRTACLLEE